MGANGALTGDKNKISGINVEVSRADFNQLKVQVSDTIRFLETNKGQIEKLVKFCGAVGTIELDFAIEKRDVVVQTDSFPSRLLYLAGNLGLGICLSQYPVSDNKESYVRI